MKSNLFFFQACLLALGMVFSSSCSKTNPTDAIIKHTESMLKIIRDNRDDCDKLIKELSTYTEEHKQDFNKLNAQAKKLEADMTPEQKAQYQAETMQKLSGTLQESIAAIMEISKKCPEKAARIGTLMNLDSVNSDESPK